MKNLEARAERVVRVTMIGTVDGTHWEVTEQQQVTPFETEQAARAYAQERRKAVLSDLRRTFNG